MDYAFLPMSFRQGNASTYWISGQEQPDEDLQVDVIAAHGGGGIPVHAFYDNASNSSSQDDVSTQGATEPSYYMVDTFETLPYPGWHQVPENQWLALSYEPATSISNTCSWVTNTPHETKLGASAIKAEFDCPDLTTGYFQVQPEDFATAGGSSWGYSDDSDDAVVIKSEDSDHVGTRTRATSHDSSTSIKSSSTEPSSRPLATIPRLIYTDLALRGVTKPPGGKVNKCSYKNADGKQCPSRFDRIEHLRRHEEIHMGITKFSCKICDRAFGRRDNGNEHYWTHVERSGRTSRNRKFPLEKVQRIVQDPSVARKLWEKLQEHERKHPKFKARL